MVKSTSVFYERGQTFKKNTSKSSKMKRVHLEVKPNTVLVEIKIAEIQDENGKSHLSAKDDFLVICCSYLFFCGCCKNA